MLPDALERRVHAFARDHRARAPGLLTDVIVTGSATLGDWRPGVSDIDLVLVTSRPTRARDLAAVRELHAGSTSDPHIDGVYLTEGQLRDGPEAVPSAMQAVDGELVDSLEGGQLNWVTWREVERGIESSVTDAGIAAWNPSARRYPLAEQGAKDHCRANLLAYWAPLGAASLDRLAELDRDAPVRAETVQWIALGPPRLVATMRTGEIISKTHAAAFVAATWPEFARLARRAAASRSGVDVAFSAAEAGLAVDILERCVAEAHRP